MQRLPPSGGERSPNGLLEKLKKPQYALPAAIVAGMLGIAFGVQPGGPPTHAEDVSTAIIQRTESSATAPATSPTTQPTKPGSALPTATQPSSPAGDNRQAAATSTTTNDVAGVRSTPSASATATATVDPALQREPTQCGELKEITVAVAVEQSISGVSMKATRVAVYPIEYFRCILMATGGQEAYGLASSVARAEGEGQTHIVLIDLWLANASKQFGQVNVRNAALAVAGQSFAPLATLGGRSEVVISSGQGRNLSLVVGISNSIGATTGPMTLIVEGPLTGGAQLPGKYQLFLPTP